MKLEGKVFLIEKFVSDNGDERTIMAKVLGPKNRNERKYATFFDASGRPIVKHYFASKTYRLKTSDVRKDKIATNEIVKCVGLCFQENDGYFIQDNDSCFIRTNFELEDRSYEHVRRFLSEGYDVGSGTIETYGQTVIIIGRYYAYLQHTGRRLKINTRLDLSEFPEIEMVRQPVIGHGTSRLPLKPRYTSQRFDSYVYDMLLETYRHFQGALFIDPTKGTEE